MPDISKKERGIEATSRGTAKDDKSTVTKEPSSNKQLAKIMGDFMQRVEANKDKDLGKRPGFLERMAIQNEWPGVVVLSEIGSQMTGKDYEMARMMMHHYLASDGAPLTYQPPQPVQNAIKKRFPRPGHYRDVSGYEKWGTPDIRNGLGHFNLDVVDAKDDGKIYVITDRYEFPDKSKGKTVRHGFQVGKRSKATVDDLNKKLSSVGEFERDSGIREKFELKEDPSTGEYTFFVPQKLLADHGADFESMGMFTVQNPKSSTSK
jgi:hypothetical protein